MYKSKEIRWFFEEENEQLWPWFNDQGLEFDSVQSRIDYYHIPSLRADLGIKLREGRIEVKQRFEGPQPGQLSKCCEGFYEEWIKWSFEIEEEDREQNDVLEERQKDHWLKVEKQRLGIKLGLIEKEEIEIFDMGEILEHGCQLEYTRIHLADKSWYTLGLEWFGRPWLELDPEILEGILGNSNLGAEHSKSYPQFLLEFISL